MASTRSSGLVIILLCCNLIVLGASLIIFGLSAFHGAPRIGSGNTTTLSQWERYDSKMKLLPGYLPPVLWLLCLLYQLVWLMYAFSTLCERSSLLLLYSHPPVMPASMYVTFLLGLLSLFGWWYFFHSGVRNFQYASLFSLVSFGFFVATTGVSCHVTKRYYQTMSEQRLRFDLFSQYGLVQNGLAFFATWMCFLSLFNAFSLLPGVETFTPDSATTAALIVTMVMTVVWAMLDLVMGRDLSRFIMSPYLVGTIVFVGVMAKNRDNQGTRFVAGAVGMASCIILFLVKILFVIIRKKKKVMPRALSTERVNFSMQYVRDSQPMERFFQFYENTAQSTLGSDMTPQAEGTPASESS